MIEAYAFLAVFTVQILTMSVLHPTWLSRHVRARATSIPAERFAQLYPGVDFDLALKRFLTRYRAVNMAIAVIGVLLLGWLFKYMQRPDWDDGPVETLTAVYFMLQVSPLLLLAWLEVKHSKALKRSLQEAKRKATLQRRGLFDFVSPFVVAVAVVGYFLFAAFAIQIEQNPFPGFAGSLINIGIVTLVYAVNAFCVYMMLYGKRINPFETHAGRIRTIGLAVKAFVYSCIAVVVVLSLNFTLVLLDLQRWEPFALSVFLVICAFLCSMGLSTPPSPSEEDGLGSSPAR